MINIVKYTESNKVIMSHFNLNENNGTGKEHLGKQ